MNEPDVTGGKAKHDKGPKEANISFVHHLSSKKN